MRITEPDFTEVILAVGVIILGIVMFFVTYF